MMYQQLDRECVKALAGESGRTGKAYLAKTHARNVRSALNLVEQLGGLDALLDAEETSSLSQRVGQHLIDAGRSNATAQSVRSNVRKLGELARALAADGDCPREAPDLSEMGLSEAIRTAFHYRWPTWLLKDCIAEAAREVELLARPEDYPKDRGNRKADLSQKEGRLAYLESRLATWVMYSRRPQHGAFSLIAVLEKALYLQPGQLTHAVSMPRSEAVEGYRQRSLAKQAQQSEKNEDEEGELEEVEEALRSFTLPEHVRLQLDRLIKTRLGKRPPPLTMASFPLKKREALDLEARRWTCDGDGHCATAQSYTLLVTHYLRWLHLEHGVPRNDLDLSLLLQDELLELYRDHCNDRDVFHSVAHLMQHTAAMAKPQVGYLSRYHVPTKPFQYESDEIEGLDESEGLLFFDDLGSWRAHEPILHRRIRQLGEVSQEGAELRDGRRNVRWITEHPDGVEAGVAELWKAIDGLADQARFANTVGEAYGAAMVAGWLALELRVPLRVKNTAELELIQAPPLHTTPSRPSFWQDKEGHFRVFVPKAFLKNGRYATGEITHVQAALRAGTRGHAVMADYLKARERLLATRHKSSRHLFCKFATVKTTGEKYLSGQHIGKRVRTQTERAFLRYLDVERLGIKGGLNPHGMRHLVAQRILAKEPNNYRKAASALMDKTSTIMAVYGSNNHAQYEAELDMDFA